MKKLGIGIVGCGNISAIYLKNCIRLFGNLEVKAVADLDVDRARARAAEFGIAKACTVDELLADPSVELVINLTIPAAHYGVGKAVLEAGKHLYNEKPLSAKWEQGEELVKLAKKKDLRLGGAPDTFLGAGIQLCRRLIDEGKIGTPLGGSAFMLSGGTESWHPDPEFFYKPGGGPLLDMGPYYLTALVSLLGPVKRLVGSEKRGYAERVIGSGPKKGEVIKVDIATHISAVLDFENGEAVTLTTSFDVPGGSTHVPIEIYGSEGTLLVPDPNTFGGPVRWKARGENEWTEVPVDLEYSANSRGLGVSDIARSLEKGEPHRASGDLTAHVLETMQGIHLSATSAAAYHLRSTCPRPEPLVQG